MTSLADGTIRGRIYIPLQLIVIRRILEDTLKTLKTSLSVSLKVMPSFFSPLWLFAENSGTGKSEVSATG